MISSRISFRLAAALAVLALALSQQERPYPPLNQTAALAPATVMPMPANEGGTVITPSGARQQTTAPGQRPTGLNANDVVAIAGWNGSVVDDGETLILSMARSLQLDLRIKNIFVPGAGSQASFRPLTDGTVNFMAELLLLDDEVGPVLRYGLSVGLEAVALHMHFLFDQPRTYFLHLHAAQIPPETAASALRNIIGTIADVRANPTPDAGPSLETRVSSLALDPIQAALSPAGLRAARQDDGTVLVRARPVTCTVMGHNASHTLGCQSTATLAGSDGDAIVYGQFCSPERNLQRVLADALHRNLTITAIVNHFAGDSPPTLFAHFWGRGPAWTLASALAGIVAGTYRAQ